MATALAYPTGKWQAPMRNLDGLYRSLVLAAVCLVPAGCQSQVSAADASGGSVKQLASPAHCGFDSAGAHLLINRSQWHRSPFGALNSANNWPWPPGSWRLIVAAGRKPTTGYGVRLASAHRSRSILHIAVASRKPPRNAATGQMLTSPCVVLEIPSTGWSSLELRGLGASIIRIPHP